MLTAPSRRRRADVHDGTHLVALRIFTDTPYKGKAHGQIGRTRTFGLLRPTQGLYQTELLSVVAQDRALTE